ncbi:MAG: hypothetical protein OEZ43_16650 [Gammaproteobacteria bacterium]|nr:hypothetical protein [Gammaproteobacteria bacterium]
MKNRLIAILLGMMIGGGAWAGSLAMDGTDPHHGVTGGCASKAKIAKLKQLYGDDWAKQKPDAKITEEAKANRVKMKSLDKFI